jgi:hypothetical protein
MELALLLAILPHQRDNLPENEDDPKESRVKRDKTKFRMTLFEPVAPDTPEVIVPLTFQVFKVINFPSHV